MYKASNDGYLFMLKMNSNSESNLLKRIKNGEGHVISTSYNLMTELGGHYTKSGSGYSYPNINIRVPLYLVTFFKNGQLQPIKYVYENAILNKTGGAYGYRAGWNSEGIRHLFQNKFAHTEHNILGLKFLHNQTYFKNLGGTGSFYSEKSSFNNPFSLWSF